GLLERGLPFDGTPKRPADASAGIERDERVRGGASLVPLALVERLERTLGRREPVSHLGRSRADPPRDGNQTQEGDRGGHAHAPSLASQPFGERGRLAIPLRAGLDRLLACAGLAPSKRDELALEILDASAKRDDLRVSLSDGLGGFLLTDPCALERSVELVRSDAEEVVLGAKRQKIVLERARSL